MGLLDQPLISEMDAMQRKARREDDEEALKYILSTLQPIVRYAVQRFQSRDGLTLKEAMKKAGVRICIR